MTIGPLDSDVAVITGGASGIGAAIAKAITAAGGSVVVGDLAAHEQTVVPTDVTSFPDLEALRDTTLERHGRVDALVANAGVADWGLMSEGDPERWRAVMDVNVLGVAFAIRAFLPILLAQGRGHIVITASVSGRVTYVGEPLYIASKWALVGLGRALRKEVAHGGIRVTLIEPGIVDTPLVSSTEVGRAELAALKPLDPKDVADAVVFALSRPEHVDIDELLLTPRAQTL